MFIEFCVSNSLLFFFIKLTANEACCACGGGTPEYELCNNFQTPEGNDWTDATGRNCDAYAQFHLCYEDGDSFAKWGMTADQACCACRGGAIGTCQDYEDFTDHANKDCSWYYENLNDEIDANTRCYFFGDDNGTYAGGTVTPNEACCVCGGGISTLDYPSFAPASETLTASSSSSSSVSSSSSFWSEVILKPDSSSFQIPSSSFYVTSLLTGLTISLILRLSIQF